MSNKPKYPVDQMTKKLAYAEMNDTGSRESLVALKIYYHDVTLAFVKDGTLHTLKYTELTQSLSSFLNYLLTIYKNDCQNMNQKYIPLREAMKIYSTKYCFKIHDFGKCLILRKVFKDQDFVSDNVIDNGDSINNDNHVCVINYKDILYQTATVSKSFIRDKLKNNCNINKKKMIEDLKKSLSVPVKSDKAMNMMYNMGWDGGSLGIRGDGIIEPIMPAIDLKAGAGLGHVNGTDGDYSKHTFMKNILKDFLEFLKTDDLCLELICPRRISKKDQGFITNLINMVNIRRRVEVNDEERAVLLNQIYEISCLKCFNITGLMDGKSRIKFTKTPTHRPFGFYDTKLSQVSAASNVRHVILSSSPPTIDLGQGPIRYANASLLNTINSRYVTPFSPLDISRQNLNLSIFKTTTLIFVLDFNGSHLNRLEVTFEKVLNAKERGYVIEIVDAINKGHNKNGCKTKIERQLMKLILATERSYYLVAGFGNCNTSFTLEKVFDRHKTSPKRLKLNSRRQRNHGTNTNNDYMNDIFASLDKAFPPLIWSETNNLPRLELDECKRYDDNRKIVSHINDRAFVKMNEDVIEDANKRNIKSNNLIIVKNVKNSDQEMDSVRKIYINRNVNGSSPYVRNTSKSCENLKSDNQSHSTIGLIKSYSENSQEFTATNDGIINYNIDEVNRESKTVDKLDHEKLHDNKNDDINRDDNSDIEISVWTYDDSDIDMLSEELSPGENIKTDSPVLPGTSEFEGITENHTKRHEIRDDITPEMVIEECVQRMNIKESSEDLCRKKRLRTDSENSDVTTFKKYKTVDRITYVNLTPKDTSDAIDDVEFVKKVQTVISLMLDITNELPLLKCHGYRNGALVYSCHNEKSLTWLQTHCVATDDIKITISEEVLVESVKMSLKINCYIDENYKKIFQRLESYNEGLSTNHWVWLKEEKFNGYVIITFKIDEISFNLIRSKNFRLFLGIDEAQFSVVWN